MEVLTLGHPSITNLSPKLGVLPHLKTLQLIDCRALECISQIPSSVTKLHIGNCSSLTTLDISYLKDLSELYVIGSPLEVLSRPELQDNLLKWKISKDKFDWKNFMEMIWEQHGVKNRKGHIYESTFHFLLFTLGERAT